MAIGLPPYDFDDIESYPPEPDLPEPDPPEPYLPEPDMEYDSTAETLKHIKRVNELLLFAAKELMDRAVRHDASKLLSPEKECFDIITPRLKSSTYGSPEYNATMAEFQPAINHHHKTNSHHPEFYKNGINGFDLFDLMELFFDWKAASERHADGDILRSIQINKERFGYSDQIADIMKNTVKRYLNKDI